MKKEIKKLEKIVEELREKLDAMEYTYDERSEKWQDSERGEEYQDKISAVDTAICDIECAITDLKAEFDI